MHMYTHTHGYLPRSGPGVAANSDRDSFVCSARRLPLLLSLTHFTLLLLQDLRFILNTYILRRNTLRQAQYG